MASNIGLTFIALIIAVVNGASLPPPPDQPALMARYIVNRAGENKFEKIYEL